MVHDLKVKNGWCFLFFVVALFFLAAVLVTFGCAT